MSDYFVKGDSAGEIWTDERCYITELSTTSHAPEGSLAIARVETGVTTQIHALTDIKEVYIVISGSGRMEVDGNQFAIAAGDQVIIPPGIAQRVTATSDEDLRFYCLCTPHFTPDVYLNL